MEGNTLPQAEMHLVTIGNILYKVKLFAKRRENADEEVEKKFWMRDDVRSDLKRIITFVLQHQDRLFPIRCDTFIVYPYKKLWKKGQQLLYFRHDVRLDVGKYELVLFVEHIENDDQTEHEKLLDVANNRLPTGNKRSKRKTDDHEDSNTASQCSTSSNSSKSKRVRVTNSASGRVTKLKNIDIATDNSQRVTRSMRKNNDGNRTGVDDTQVSANRLRGSTVDGRQRNDDHSCSTTAEEDTTVYHDIRTRIDKGRPSKSSSIKTSDKDNINKIADFKRLEQVTNNATQSEPQKQQRQRSFLMSILSRFSKR